MPRPLLVPQFACVRSHVYLQWLALASVFFLAGCPTTPLREPPQRPWDQVRGELQNLASFALKGKVGVAAGGEGFNARLRWQQSGETADLSLDGPLGVGGVRVLAEGEDLFVSTSSGERLNNDAAREELRRRLGFEPPISSLRYWVLGVPNPSQPADETLGEQQRLAGLQQDGWNVEYSSYAPAGEHWLPQRLSLSRDNVRVRLFIDSWE